MIASFTYGAYGELLSGSTEDTQFLYNGQYGILTDDNGLYYMRQCYYNPEIKRFINQDVLAGSMGNSQSLNRYSYVQGNPVNYTDPFGLSPAEQSFKDVGHWHVALGILGFCPNPYVEVPANIIDGMLYAIVDKDMLMAVACIGGAASMGSTRFAAYAFKNMKYAKLGEIAEKIGRYSGQLAAGMGFVKSAEMTMDDMLALDNKYRIQGQGVGLGTIKEGGRLLYDIMLTRIAAHGMAGSSRKSLELEVQYAQKSSGEASITAADVINGTASVAGAIEGGSNTVWVGKDPYVPELANSIEAKFPGRVQAVERDIIIDDIKKTDFDIELDSIVIQVKSGKGKGLVNQMKRTAALTDKTVISYTPDIKQSAAVLRGVRKEGFNTFTELEDILDFIGKH